MATFDRAITPAARALLADLAAGPVSLVTGRKAVSVTRGRTVYFYERNGGAQQHEGAALFDLGCAGFARWDGSHSSTFEITPEGRAFLEAVG